jgi:hypothetical protein
MFGFPCQPKQYAFDFEVNNLTHLFCKDVHVKWVIKK